MSLNIYEDVIYVTFLVLKFAASWTKRFSPTHKLKVNIYFIFHLVKWYPDNRPKFRPVIGVSAGLLKQPL